MSERIKQWTCRGLLLSLCLAIIACLAAGVMSLVAAVDDPPDLAASPGFARPAAGDSTDTILHIGDKFPPLQAIDFDGHVVTFDQRLLGRRYTLLVFWSTWCGFC